jgi:rhomboid family GlyGly-CTERM serine protease
MVAVGSLLLFFLTDSARLFVYDRDRVLAGEFWRLITGHAVHFSWSHLGYNLALFAVTGWWLEYRDRLQFVWLLTLTVLVSGLYFLVIMPDMAIYGGLSGLVSATVVYLSLCEIRYNRDTRLIWALILLLFAGKVGFELFTGDAVFVSPDITPFRVVPAVHIIGGLVAVMLFYLVQQYRSR